MGILRRLLIMVRHFFLGVCIRIRLDRDSAHSSAIVILDVEPLLSD